MGPEHADIDVTQILRTATRDGRNIFAVFRKKQGELLGRKQLAVGGLSKTKEIARGRKVENLKWKISESGMSPLEVRPKEC